MEGGAVSAMRGVLLGGGFDRATQQVLTKLLDGLPESSAGSADARREPSPGKDASSASRLPRPAMPDPCRPGGVDLPPLPKELAKSTVDGDVVRLCKAMLPSSGAGAGAASSLYLGQLLTRAASAGLTEVARHLVRECRAPLPTAEADGPSPLAAAVWSERWATAHAVLDLYAEATVPVQGIMPAVCGYAAQCDAGLQLLPRLLEVGGDACFRPDATGHTPLYRAAIVGNTAAVRELLAKAPSSITALGELCGPALGAAADQGQLAAVQALLKGGAAACALTTPHYADRVTRLVADRACETHGGCAACRAAPEPDAAASSSSSSARPRMCCLRSAHGSSAAASPVAGDGAGNGSFSNGSPAAGDGGGKRGGRGGAGGGAGSGSAGSEGGSDSSTSSGSSSAHEPGGGPGDFTITGRCSDYPAILKALVRAGFTGALSHPQVASGLGQLVAAAAGSGSASGRGSSSASDKSSVGDKGTSAGAGAAASKAGSGSGDKSGKTAGRPVSEDSLVLSVTFE